MKKRGLISPLFLLALWSALTYGNVVNTALIPHPHKVIAELWRYFTTGDAVKDILPTLKRLFCGLAIGAVIGIFIGMLLGYFKKLYETMNPVIDFFRSIPATSLFPIFMLMFGLGDSSKIMLVIYGSTFIMIINTVYGVKNSNKTRVLAAETMGASKLQILTQVVLPDTLPYIVAGLRIAISLSLTITVVSEMFFGSNAGLGYRIMESKILYDIPNVFAALITTGFLGYTLNKLFILIEERVAHWGGK